MSERVSAADIEDEDSLRAWLEARPREDALWIAHRVILRVLPLWGAAMDAPWARKGDLTTLPLLRCGVISAVAATMPNANIREEATYATYSTATATTNASTAATLAAARASTAAARASTSTAATYAATTAAAAAARATLATVWATVRADAEVLEAGAVPGKLWPGAVPDYFAVAEAQMMRIWDTEPAARWAFWRRWWTAAVAGQPLDPALQLAIVQGVDNETWEDTDKTAARIAEIEAGFVPPLSDAAFAEFRFDEVHQWMALTDFTDDLDHLRDPAIIQAFHEDCEDLRDQLQDFADYARDEMRVKGNAAVGMVTAADKLLRELQRAEGAERLRARRFVQLGSAAELRAAIEADRECVSEVNARALDAALDEFRAVCRKHLGPVLRRMGPLDKFTLDGADPKEMVALLSDVVARIKAAQIDGLQPIDPEAKTLFDDLVDGLEDLRTQMAEAKTPDRAAYLGQRFARNYAGSVATVKRLSERAAPYAEGTTKVVDGAIRNAGRWTKIAQLTDWLKELLW